ncbi:MAG: inorganic phosphate transporter, partial [Candidatus Diapherotrites archaeon]|nr:inorganic phosphate transporter [Candidatus Diapherotrites archaeon]
MLAGITIALALFFDFVNGFHDAANSISTVVATRVLTPFQAVLMAAFWNFIGAFVFGVAIAKTVGSGIIVKDAATVPVILAALLGATLWNLLTWRLGIPSSSSHALVGGLIGAAVAYAGIHTILSGGVANIILFIVVAPLLGLVGAILFTIIVFRISRRVPPLQVNSWFKRLQL